MADGDYGKWNLVDLRQELGNRKAKKTGKKADLVQRLEFYDRNDNFGMRLIQDDENSYSIITPDRTDYKDLNADSKVPTITEQALDGYLAPYGKKLDEKIKDLYRERFLSYVRSAIHQGKIYIMANCAAEMKKKVSYAVDVVVNPQGLVLECQCECAVGTGPNAHCKHILCLLYGLACFSKNRIILTKETCTQRLQTFNRCQPFKGSPIKSSQLHIRSSGKGRDLHQMIDYDPRPKKYRHMDCYTSFFQNLCVNHQASQIVPSESLPMPILQSVPPANIIALSKDHDYLLECPEDRFLEAFGVHNVSKHQIDNVELQTRGQSTNRQWGCERIKRLTSSNFGRICKCTDRTDKKSLALSYTMNQPVFSKAMQHGCTFEAKAVLSYEENHVVTQPCGLFVSKSHPFISSSPDRIIDQTTVLEVKCPFSSCHQEITPLTVPYLKTVDGNLTIHEQHDYYYQVQGQMYCTGRTLCHFVIYTFQDMKVLKIKRNDQFITTMISKLSDFYNLYFRPALLDKYFYKNTDKYTFTG